MDKYLVNNVIRYRVYNFESDHEDRINAHELSDLSDSFSDDMIDNDDSLTSFNRSATATLEKNLQSLAFDDVPYDRDVKWINIPNNARPKSTILQNQQMLKQVQSITGHNQLELARMDQRYLEMDNRKREHDQKFIVEYNNSNNQRLEKNRNRRNRKGRKNGARKGREDGNNDSSDDSENDVEGHYIPTQEQMNAKYYNAIRGDIDMEGKLSMASNFDQRFNPNIPQSNQSIQHVLDNKQMAEDQAYSGRHNQQFDRNRMVNVNQSNPLQHFPHQNSGHSQRNEGKFPSAQNLNILHWSNDQNSSPSYPNASQFTPTPRSNMSKGIPASLGSRSIENSMHEEEYLANGSKYATQSPSPGLQSHQHTQVSQQKFHQFPSAIRNSSGDNIHDNDHVIYRTKSGGDQPFPEQSNFQHQGGPGGSDMMQRGRLQQDVYHGSANRPPNKFHLNQQYQQPPKQVNYNQARYSGYQPAYQTQQQPHHHHQHQQQQQHEQYPSQHKQNHYNPTNFRNDSRKHNPGYNMTTQMQTYSDNKIQYAHNANSAGGGVPNTNINHRYNQGPTPNLVDKNEQVVANFLSEQPNSGASLNPQPSSANLDHRSIADGLSFTPPLPPSSANIPSPKLNPNAKAFIPSSTNANEYPR